MLGCTHPSFGMCQIISVYAAPSAMAYVEGASLLGIRDGGWEFNVLLRMSVRQTVQHRPRMMSLALM